MVIPDGLVTSCAIVPNSSGVPGGGAIFRPCVYFVDCICWGIVITCVVIRSSPGFCGYVVARHSRGAKSRLGWAALYAFRSLVMFISWLIVLLLRRTIVWIKRRVI